jgi:hypothetical protein
MNCCDSALMFSPYSAAVFTLLFLVLFLFVKEIIVCIAVSLTCLLWGLLMFVISFNAKFIICGVTDTIIDVLTMELAYSEYECMCHLRSCLPGSKGLPRVCI